MERDERTAIYRLLLAQYTVRNPGYRRMWEKWRQLVADRGEWSRSAGVLNACATRKFGLFMDPADDMFDSGYLLDRLATGLANVDLFALPGPVGLGHKYAVRLVGDGDDLRTKPRQGHSHTRILREERLFARHLDGDFSAERGLDDLAAAGKVRSPALLDRVSGLWLYDRVAVGASISRAGDSLIELYQERYAPWGRSSFRLKDLLCVDFKFAYDRARRCVLEAEVTS